MKKILITGASGFIGSHLLEYLIQDAEPSENIRLLIPPEESLNGLPRGLFELVIGDVRNKSDVDRSVQDVDVIYHLAAKTIIPDGSYSYYKDVNVDGTQNLIDAAKKYRLKKFILFSSISVFGLPAWAGDIIGCDESWPKKYSEPYGHTKLDAEKIILNAHKNWGLNYIIIRPTTVYGPRDKAGISQLLKAINYGIFFFIGNGENKMDYVYVKDLVRVARLAEKSKVSNEDFIIGSCNPITQKKLVKAASHALGKLSTKIYIPKFIALILAKFVENISGILKIKPLIFQDRVKVLTSNCYYDSSKAQKTLGYKPRFSFGKGIDITAQWMKSRVF